MMKKGGVGGGNTITGLRFEAKISVQNKIASLPGYSVSNDIVYFKNKKVAELYPKHKFYKNFLEKNGVDHSKIVSARLLPDEAIFVLQNKTLYIIEMKFQEGQGSVDEKLQTCDFKNKKYNKLLSSLGISVKYVYFLSDWFKQGKYRDVLEYVESVGCYYFFDEVPLDFLGLPLPKING